MADTKLCWSSHILAAKAWHNLTRSSKKSLNCEPIDLSRFVVNHRERHLEFWTPFSKSHPRGRNSKTLTTSGAHCLHKELWLPILLVGFPGTCFLTFLEMSFAVWLVSDFAPTPFALKPQLEIPPLPLLATYVRLMIMSRMKSMFSFTACTLRWILSAGNTRSYFQRQDYFYTPGKQHSFFSFMNLFYFMNRRAVKLLDWRPFFVIL